MTATEILSAIDQIAAKFGVAATEVFSILEAQAKIQLVHYIVCDIAEFALACFTVWLFWRLFIRKSKIIRAYSGEEKNVSFIKYHANEAEDDSSEGIAIVSVITISVLVILSLVSLVDIVLSVSGIMTCLLNPKYYALQLLFK